MKCSLGISHFFEEISAATAAAKSLQSCLTLCDPIDSSPPGSAVPGILQARTLGGLPLPSPEELYKKDLHDPDNHDGVIIHLEPDILECKVK